MSIAFYTATGGPVPKIEIEILLQNAGSLPDASNYRDIWIIAEHSGGTASDNDVYDGPFSDMSAAIAWWGAGSPGAAMAASIYKHREPSVGRPKGKIYGIALPASGGVAATQTLTFATTATGSGTWVFSVGGHQVSFSVASGDTATNQGDAFVAAWNALNEWEKPPVTAANAIGVVTLTAKVAAGHYNTIGLSTVQDPGVTTTATWGAANMAGGTQYAAMTTLLAKVTSTRTPIIVTTADLDGNGTPGDTQFEDLVDHINTKADGTNMLSATLICADIDTASNLVADADTLDDDDGERVLCAGAQGIETWTGEIAAKVAAAIAGEPHLARSSNGLVVDIDTPSAADNWTEAEMETLIEGGVTPLWVRPGDDQMRIVRAVSIRTEYGELDFALMPTLDYVRDSLNARLSAQFDRASIVADSAELPDAAHVVQPKVIKAAAKEVMLELEEEGYLTNVDTDWESVDDNLSGTTYQLAIPVTMVPQLHNIMARLDQEVG